MDRLGIESAAFVGETFAGCRPAIHLAIKRPDLVSSLALISPGFFDGEPPEVKEVFRELKEMFMETNQAIKDGRIPKTYAGRVAPPEALQVRCTAPPFYKNCHLPGSIKVYYIGILQLLLRHLFTTRTVGERDGHSRSSTRSM